MSKPQTGHARPLCEVVLLFVTAPFLFFPGWFPGWVPVLVLMLLVGAWLGLRWQAGRPIWTRTAIDLPLGLLLALMLPISILVAPQELRWLYSIPRGYLLLWCVLLFWTVVTYASTAEYWAHWFLRGFLLTGIAIALVAPLGMQWLYKIEFLTPIIDRIPRIFIGVFQGAESGFSPNQVAGALLYVLPVCLVSLVMGYSRRHEWRDRWLMLVGALIMASTLFLSQSRGALIGLCVGVVLTLILVQRRGVLIALVAVLAVLLTVPLWWSPLMQFAYGGNEYVSTAALNLDWRREVWINAVKTINEFPLTGVGFGTFRIVARWLYAFHGVLINYDIAHAHNFFLQAAVDFGLLGLIAVIALYFSSAGQLAMIWLTADPVRQSEQRMLALGFGCALLSQTIYSLSDSVSMGAKPGLLFWWLFALVASHSNLHAHSRHNVQAET